MHFVYISSYQAYIHLSQKELGCLLPSKSHGFIRNLQTKQILSIRQNSEHKLCLVCPSKCTNEQATKGRGCRKEQATNRKGRSGSDQVTWQRRAARATAFLAAASSAAYGFPTTSVACDMVAPWRASGGARDKTNLGNNYCDVRIIFAFSNMDT